MRVAVNCADVREDRISSGEMDLVGQHVKDEGEGGVKMDYLNCLAGNLLNRRKSLQMI